MAENDSPNAFDRILGWLHQGYPHGVPQTDYFALLALLARTLTEDEVVKVAQLVLKGNDSDSVTAEEIRAAIHLVTDKEPNPEEMHQVAARLASVGWPLAAPAS
ncbi:DUF3349 domain-containing protein [Mycolicibacterium sp. BiH015]|uniref:DUF3349 domain-containing protein n=1 Tax=Mycolicibacterium sp. BiH015 TaxID=3018808 RepID=UPI0022E16310|nr:DUF3349 domain-containing protein [Mycolicibacterium sp. BiH015]MDA2891809.1 DUF3349 domain-containing protein [Mycolicibacterium sp. BiH015]